MILSEFERERERSSYTVVQLNFTQEIEVFYMLVEISLSILSMTYISQTENGIFQFPVENPVGSPCTLHCTRIVFTLSHSVREMELFQWNCNLELYNFPHFRTTLLSEIRLCSLRHLPRLTLATIICLRRRRPPHPIPPSFSKQKRPPTLWIGKNCTQSKKGWEEATLLSNLA